MTAPAAAPGDTHYVPDFELALDGQPVPAELRARIMGVRFEEALEGANRVEIEFADPDLGILDRPLLDLDTSLQLALGYRPSGIHRVFSGTVTGLETTLPATGMPVLLVSGHDATSRLSEGAKERGFPFYLTDAVIASIVAAENGLIALPDVAASIATGLGAAFSKRPRFQHKQSDYAFLRRIATEYGFDMWVDGAFLNFRLSLPRLPVPEIELRWGESLLEFAPRITSIGQVVRVRARVWVESLKTQLSVEVDWDGERIRTRVRPAVLGEQSEELQASIGIPDIPLESPVDAIKFAVAELRRKLNNRVTAKGSALGDPRFRVGRTLSIASVGNRFSGATYRLTSVVHTLDTNGYRTAFQVRREVI
ncbi:phage late control D family protein [Streptomyces flaveus]|uniref:phage late control D family protein n=1 Tax=Streptomyces flaveus TaxID=66370 RepID=UPI003318A943